MLATRAQLITTHFITQLQHCVAGASIWKFASTDEGISPDVVLVGIGVEMTFEVIAAAALLRKEIPALRVRVVNVTDLMILGPHGSHPHALSDGGFQTLFTTDKPVIFNYHGYPVELRVRLLPLAPNRLDQWLTHALRDSCSGGRTSNG